MSLTRVVEVYSFQAVLITEYQVLEQFYLTIVQSKVMRQVIFGHLSFVTVIQTYPPPPFKY